jgi:hypothetical protein
MTPQGWVIHTLGGNLWVRDERGGGLVWGVVTDFPQKHVAGD